jgi:hypothetical protein
MTSFSSGSMWISLVGVENVARGLLVDARLIAFELLFARLLLVDAVDRVLDPLPAADERFGRLAENDPDVVERLGVERIAADDVDRRIVLAHHEHLVRFGERDRNARRHRGGDGRGIDPFDQWKLGLLAEHPRQGHLVDPSRVHEQIE